METLTAQQAKQVIEYLAAQAAEDAPTHDADKHMWMTRYQASLAIERQITEADWDRLVAATADLQSYDRDADAFLYQLGVHSANKFIMHEDLQDQVSWAIDTAYACSGV